MVVSCSNQETMRIITFINVMIIVSYCEGKLNLSIFEENSPHGFLNFQMLISP